VRSRIESDEIVQMTEVCQRFSGSIPSCASDSASYIDSCAVLPAASAAGADARRIAVVFTHSHDGRAAPVMIWTSLGPQELGTAQLANMALLAFSIPHYDSMALVVPAGDALQLRHVVKHSGLHCYEVINSGEAG